GWRSAIKNRNVRASVSFEPGFDFPFPEGDVPPPMTLGGRALSPITVSQSEFMLLTKIPIVIYYGDNIPDKPSVNPGQEQWRIFFEMAKRWRDVVNRHGGSRHPATSWPFRKKCATAPGRDSRSACRGYCRRNR